VGLTGEGAIRSGGKSIGDLCWLLGISVREHAISELFDSPSFWEKS
jgi:hypothetical protein